MADSVNSTSAATSVADALNAMSNRKSSNSVMGMDDFLKLIVAQLQNQDMMNPMNDTEFIGQMAQFSTVQAMTNMLELSNTNYAVSMVGKEVTAAVINKEGQLEKTIGVVTGVGLFNGEPIIYIGDKQFALSSIMAVGKMPDPPKEDEEEKDPDTKPPGGGEGGSDNPPSTTQT